MGFKTNPPTHEITDISQFGPIPPPPTSNVPDLGGAGSGTAITDYAAFFLPYTGGGSYVDPVVPRSTLNNSSKSNSQQQATIAGAGSVIPIIYGRRRIGGRIAAIQIYNSKMYVLVVWCWGTTLGVDAIESVEVSNKAFTLQSGDANHLGNQTSADSTLVAAKNAEHQTYSDILPGICYSVIGIEDSKSGFPTFNATIRGLKVASTSGGAKSYSTVPAYIIADFIENTDYGMGSAVNWSDVALLATRNNQTVGGVARNQLDVALDNPQTKSAWLAVLCDYAGCFPFKEGNTWRLMVDAPVSPSPIISLGAGDLVSGSLKLTEKDTANSPTVMQISYTDTSKTPWADAQATAYASGVLAGTVTRRVTQIAKPGITRYAEAYRYAVQRLNEAIVASLSCSFVMFDRGLTMEVGDVFALTHPIGLTAKLFRCLQMDPAQPGRWTVSGSEYDSAKYSNSVATGPTTLDSTLPSPFDAPALTGLDVEEDIYQVQTGLFGSRLNVTWDAATWAFANLGYQVTITQAGVVKDGPITVTGQSYLSKQLTENLQYDVNVCVISLDLGVTGAVSTVSIVTNGKSAIPSDVSILNGYDVSGEVRLSWSPATDLDLTGYELRYGSTSDTWATSTLLDRVATPTLRYVTKIVPPGTKRFFIKALDSVRSTQYPFGQYSANAAWCDVEISTAPDSFLAATYTWNNPSLDHMVVVSNGWQTDYGTTFGTLFPSTIGSYNAHILAWYFGSGTSTLLTETYDLGQVYAGVLTNNATVTDINGTAVISLESSLDNSVWTSFPGQSAQISGRYVRLRITTTGVMLVTSMGSMQLSVIALSETGTVMTSATGWVTVTLARKYSRVKTIQLTSDGSLGVANPVYDQNSITLVGDPRYVATTYVPEDYVDEAYSPYGSFNVECFDNNDNLLARSTNYLFQGI